MENLKEISIDGDIYEIRKIDVTHFSMKRKGSEGNPWPYHIEQVSHQEYYGEVKEFLRNRVA